MRESTEVHEAVQPQVQGGNLQRFMKWCSHRYREGIYRGAWSGAATGTGRESTEVHEAVQPQVQGGNLQMFMKRCSHRYSEGMYRGA